MFLLVYLSMCCVRVCVCVCVCVCARARACACVCARMCVYARTPVSISDDVRNLYLYLNQTNSCNSQAHVQLNQEEIHIIQRSFKHESPANEAQKQKPCSRWLFCQPLSWLSAAIAVYRARHRTPYNRAVLWNTAENEKSFRFFFH